MAWDTESTKTRLKAAATAEFAEHGLAAATMEQIARRAGINKERLYNYFGSKPKLFAAVLAAELDRVAASVPLPAITTPADVGQWAAEVFTYHQRQPQLTRLLLWEGLADLAEPPNQAARAEQYAKKVAVFAEAQHRDIITSEIPAASLLFMVIGLAAWWQVAPQLPRLMAIPEAEEQARTTLISAAATALVTRPPTA